MSLRSDVEPPLEGGGPLVTVITYCKQVASRSLTTALDP